MGTQSIQYKRMVDIQVIGFRRRKDRPLAVVLDIRIGESSFQRTLEAGDIWMGDLFIQREVEDAQAEQVS